MHIMKINPWTLGLISAGLISLPAATQADEKPASSVMTALSATTLSGFVDTSAQWNFGTGNAALPPYAFGGSAKADGFNLNVVELILEKPTDPAADVWAAGYKVDLIAGPDANNLGTQSVFGSGSKASQGDFGVKQAYVTLHAPIAANGLDFKLGVWDTPIGYEVFTSALNPNFTRSYGYTMEPTTHTGISSTYNFCDSFSATAGVIDTFGSKINERANPPKAESFKGYLGMVTFTAPTNAPGFLPGSTLSGVIINGYNSGAGTATTIGENQTSYYLGATLNTPVTGLKVGAAFDYMNVHHASGETWALGGYASFQATEKLSFNARGEYVRDRGEQKLFRSRSIDPDSGDLVVGPDTAPDRILELTATVQYDLWKNVLSRLELRWDHSLSGQRTWGNVDPDTGEGSLKNEWLLVANVVYKF